MFTDGRVDTEESGTTIEGWLALGGGERLNGEDSVTVGCRVGQEGPLLDILSVNPIRCKGRKKTNDLVRAVVTSVRRKNGVAVRERAVEVVEDMTGSDVRDHVVLTARRGDGVGRGAERSKSSNHCRNLRLNFRVQNSLRAVEMSLQLKSKRQNPRAFIRKESPRL